eukprot:5574387-Prymnesium_polylepis.1
MNVESNTFTGDDGRVMQWPTKYVLYKKQPDHGQDDVNIPINPREMGGTKENRFDIASNEDLQRHLYFNQFYHGVYEYVQPKEPQIFAPAPGQSTLSQAVVPPVS